MIELVEEFLSHLKDEEGYSEHTLTAYRSDLKQFIDFWGEKRAPAVPTWSEVTTEGIIEYVIYLKERSYALSTLARKMAALRSFFHYLYGRKLISDDPTVALKTPKIPRRAPRILTKEQMARLLEAPAKREGAKALRDRAILELLYSTGMKASELISLNVDDVDLASGTVRIIYKKGAERLAYLSPSALEALRLYLQKGRRHFLSQEGDSSALFMNLQGERLTRQGLWVIIKQYAEQAGIKSSISPNTFRHSLVVHKLQEGVPPGEIEKLLGYSAPLNVLLYSQPVEEG